MLIIFVYMSDISPMLSLNTYYYSRLHLCIVIMCTIANLHAYLNT